MLLELIVGYLPGASGSLSASDGLLGAGRWGSHILTVVAVILQQRHCGGVSVDV